MFPSLKESQIWTNKKIAKNSILLLFQRQNWHDTSKARKWCSPQFQPIHQM